jgi:hypothetical protein
LGEREQGAFAAGKHGLACDMEDSPVNEVDLGPLGNDQPIGNTLHFVLPQRDVRAFIYDHDGDCLSLALDCVATRLHLRTRHGRQPACLRF